jgi:hypothetical protein
LFPVTEEGRRNGFRKAVSVTSGPLVQQKKKKKKKKKRRGRRMRRRRRRRLFRGKVWYST